MRTAPLQSGRRGPRSRGLARRGQNGQRRDTTPGSPLSLHPGGLENGGLGPLLRGARRGHVSLTGQLIPITKISKNTNDFLNTIHAAGKRRPLISIQSDIIIISFSLKASRLSSLTHLSMARDRCRSMAWLRAPKYSAAPLGSEPQSRL